MKRRSLNFLLVACLTVLAAGLVPAASAYASDISLSASVDLVPEPVALDAVAVPASVDQVVAPVVLGAVATIVDAVSVERFGGLAPHPEPVHEVMVFDPYLAGAIQPPGTG